MADSNITKRALANALKELMLELPFSKITIAQICDKCEMNRKSFYYHFKDKYDLANWIFDTDFISIVKSGVDDKWTFLEKMCSYFYENKSFYRQIWKIHGQNSFEEHIQEIMSPLLENKLKKIMGNEEIPQLYIDFYKGAVMNAIGCWLLSKEDMASEKFVLLLKSLIQRCAISICEEISTDDSFPRK